MSDWPWVVASYALTWTVLAGYAVWIHFGLDAARRRLETETRNAPGGLEAE